MRKLLAPTIDGHADLVDFSPGTLRPVERRRLAGWMVVSLLAHAAITAGTGLNTSNSYTPSPLRVELLRTPATEPSPLTTKSVTESAVEAVPELPQPNAQQQPAVETSATAPAADIPRLANLPLDIYYASREVDVRAEPLNEAPLVYPLVPFRNKVPGYVRLNIFVNEHGDIDRINILEASPPGLFEDAALKAVNELRFSPALKNGIPVKNRKTIEIRFDPYEKVNTP